MGKKSRYAGYYKATLKQKKKPVRSTQKSILGRLKELKEQEEAEKASGNEYLPIAQQVAKAEEE